MGKEYKRYYNSHNRAPNHEQRVIVKVDGEWKAATFVAGDPQDGDLSYFAVDGIEEPVNGVYIWTPYF